MIPSRINPLGLSRGYGYVAPGILAHWDGYHLCNNPGVWPDISGAGHHGTITRQSGAIARGSSYIDIASNGATGNVMSPVESAPIDSPGIKALTIEIVGGWRTSKLGNLYATISLGGTGSYRMPCVCAVPGGWWGFGANYGDFATTRKIIPGEILHCAITASGSAISIYINGVHAASGTAALIYSDSIRLGLGGWFAASSDTRTYAARYYRRALTAAEIMHNYTIDKQRFNL